MLCFLIFFLFSHLLGKCLVSWAFFFAAHRILFTLQINPRRERMSFPFYCWVRWASSPCMVCVAHESGTGPRAVWPPKPACLFAGTLASVLRWSVGPLHTISLPTFPWSSHFSPSPRHSVSMDSRCLQSVSCSACDEDGGRLRWDAEMFLFICGPAWRKRTSSLPDSLGGLIHEFSVHLYHLLKTSSSLFRIRNLKKAYGKGEHEKVEALKGNEITSYITYWCNLAMVPHCYTVPVTIKNRYSGCHELSLFEHIMVSSK